MTLADRLDDFGKPAWIALIVLGFVVFWPLGFVALGYMIGSKRMGCWTGRGGYGPEAAGEGAGRPLRQKMGSGRTARCRKGRAMGTAPRLRPMGHGTGYGRQSSSHAFDEYRANTLRRLEEEQREFMGFLDRLRHAKDKAEFDQFMAERRSRPENPAPPPPQY